MKDWSRTTVGERLQHLRALISRHEGKELTQNRFGERFGLESGPTSRWFTDPKLVAERDPTTVLKIAAGLAEFGVTAEWLVSGAGPPPHLPTPEAPARAVVYDDPLHLDRYRDQSDDDEARATLLAILRATGAPQYTEADLLQVRQKDFRGKTRDGRPDYAVWWRQLEDARRARERRELAPGPGGPAVASTPASEGEGGHQEATGVQPQLGGVRPKGARAGRRPGAEDVARVERGKKGR